MGPGSSEMPDTENGDQGGERRKRIYWSHVPISVGFPMPMPNYNVTGGANRLDRLDLKTTNYDHSKR